VNEWNVNRDMGKIRINDNSNLHLYINNEMQKIKFHYVFVFCSIPRLLYRCVFKYLLENNIIVSGVHCGSAVRFGQALPGFLITAHHLYASLL